jgi:adenosylhomocysteinase
VLLANAGHFPIEIDVAHIKASAEDQIEMGEAITRYLLADGRMMNLAGPFPKGNTIESMDLGFAMQARSLERVALHHNDLPPGAQPVPDDINRSLALAFVDAMQGGRGTRPHHG